MLGVYEGDLAAPLLGFRHDMEGQSGLAGGLRSIDLHDPALGYAANPQRQVQRQRPGGDGLHHHAGVLAQTHDGPLAVGLFDLSHAGFQRLPLVAGGRRNLHGGLLFICQV